MEVPCLFSPPPAPPWKHPSRCHDRLSLLSSGGEKGSFFLHQQDSRPLPFTRKHLLNPFFLESDIVRAVSPPRSVCRSFLS